MLLDELDKLSYGLSGCKLFLARDGVLRKEASSGEYNDRLQKQIQKQIFFAHQHQTNMLTPRIMSDGYTEDGRYYAEMEYIPGPTIGGCLTHFSLKELDIVIEAILSYMNVSLENGLMYDKGELSHKIIEKLDSLWVQSNHKKIIEHLKRDVQKGALVRCPVPKGFCHGDLTLENMIFHSNQVYLIDFLDSFVDSPLIDIIKLKQDLYNGWFLRHASIEDVVRIKQSSYYIWMNVYREYMTHAHNPTFYVLDILNYLRIEPYITNENDKILLNTAIKETYLCVA